MFVPNIILARLRARDILSLEEEKREPYLDKVLSDLREARDQISQNSSNSSRPPSSDAPWKSRSNELESCESELQSVPFALFLNEQEELKDENKSDKGKKSEEFETENPSSSSISSD